MSDLNYILKDGKPEPVSDILEWAKWMDEPSNRFVAQDRVNGKTLVSTIFLGIDHGWGQNKEPVLFETMVFTEGGMTDDTRRYTSLGRARAGHRQFLRKYGQ